MNPDVTRIYLVRHGQTDFNNEKRIQGHSNGPGNKLNKTGKEEARTVAKKLQNVTFDHIFSSDLSRALKTCKIITDGKEPITDERIRERNWKEWEGRPEKEFFDANEVEHWKQVESDDEVRDRAVPCLNEIAQKHIGNTVLVVSHGGLMRNVLIRIFDLDCRVDNITAKNLCYYTLEYSGEKWSLGKDHEGVILPDKYQHLLQ